MVRRNDQRRAALTDGAIEVLAEQGARGLTFRAVDVAAGLPAGTASNYFRHRDDLLIQTGRRVYERLDPGEDALREARSGVPDKTRYLALMRDAVRRVSGFRNGYLALLELRLEATRRPELRALLTERVRSDVEANVAAHADSGLPGDAVAVKLLILALNWLIVEQLTLPEMYDAEERETLLEEAVDRLVR